MELISREAVKQAIRDKFKDVPTRCEINEVINSIPTAEERKEGEWEEYIDRWHGGLMGRCSNCGRGEINAVRYDLGGNRHTMNFCPNCGAKMERRAE